MTDEQLHALRFPGESPDYRRARNHLLEAETALRRQTEEVAAQRRRLPLGGLVPTDYLFDQADLDGDEVRHVRLSELFADGKDILFLYSFMYGPDDDAPCPLCTSFMDAMDGELKHVLQRINVAAAARSPIMRFREHARQRGWTSLRLLSSSANQFNVDYHAEDSDGAQRPIAHIFVRTDEGVRHAYSTEMFFVPTGAGQSPRHIDSMWPLWNVFDLTPIGRGDTWWPQLHY